MALLFPLISTSIVQAVGAASAQFSATMAAGELWSFQSTTNCFIAQGANPTAAAANGSVAVAAGQLVLIDGALGAKLAVIQQAAGGSASLCRMRVDGDPRGSRFPTG